MKLTDLLSSASAGAAVGIVWGAAEQLALAGTESVDHEFAVVLFTAGVFGVIGATVALVASPLTGRFRGRENGATPAWAAGVAVAGFAVTVYLAELVNRVAFPLSGFSDPLQTGSDILIAAGVVVVGLVLIRRPPRPGTRELPLGRGFRAAPLLSLPVLLLLPAVLAGEPAANDSEPRPNLLLVSIDTVRADHLSCYGYERETSPNLDRLAEEGLFCRRAYSQSSHSLSSHASMLTGLYPHEHGTFSPSVAGARPIPSAVRTLAEVLADEGYATGAFVDNPWLGTEFGFTQGFGDYVNGGSVLRRSGFDPAQALEGTVLGRWYGKAAGTFRLRTGIATVSGATAWIRRKRGVPFFCFLHMIDPHTPYSPPSPYSEMFDGGYRGSLRLDVRTSLAVMNGRRVLTPEELDYAVSQYDGEIRYADAELGRTLDLLDELDLAGRTLVVVTSDHGEVLRNQRPIFSHYGTFEVCTRVPLVFRFGRESSATGVVEEVVQSIDIVPTALAFLGVDPPSYPLAGNRLWPFPPEIRRPYALLTTNSGAEKAVRTKEFRYVVNLKGEEQLFRPDDDGTEGADLSGTHEALLDECSGLLKGWRRNLHRFVSDEEIDLEGLDPATIDRLRSLGYVK